LAYKKSKMFFLAGLDSPNQLELSRQIAIRAHADMPTPGRRRDDDSRKIITLRLQQCVHGERTGAVFARRSTTTGSAVGSPELCSRPENYGEDAGAISHDERCGRTRLLSMLDRVAFLEVTASQALEMVVLLRR
jgi:hypothetical protein